MADRPAKDEPRLTGDELEAMLPLVLNLQRLIANRLRSGLRPRDELASISVTSCSHHSCN